MSLKTVGQLAKVVGVRPSTLRYYEAEGLLAPTQRSEAGYRLYDEAAEQTVRLIQRAQHLGFSLSDIHTLLQGRHNGQLHDETVIQTAEARYLALERQITQLLVVQHELSLFLQDMYRDHQPPHAFASDHFSQLLERVCRNPLNKPAHAVLDWLIEHTGCLLRSSDIQTLLHPLRGHHLHIWQADDAFHILIPVATPAVGESLQALVQLEIDCQLQQHQTSHPELQHTPDGYLFIARGSHAFIFARLFLALEQETEIAP